MCLKWSDIVYCRTSHTSRTIWCLCRSKRRIHREHNRSTP
jgi:hypothetical protein